MAYNNYRNVDDKYYGGRSHGNRQDSYSNRPKKKNNGAKEGRQKTGKNEGGVVVTGWNKTKSRGFITVKAFENQKSTAYKNKKGEKGITMMFEIFFHDSGQKVLEVAPYNLNTGVVRLEKMNMLISTKKNYFGMIPKR